MNEVRLPSPGLPMMTRLTAVSMQLPRGPQEGRRRLSFTRLDTTWLTPAIRRQASRGVTIIFLLGL